MDVNVDRKDESVEQMDVYMNRWTCSPPLSIHVSYREKRYDFVLRQRGKKKNRINTFVYVCTEIGGG